MEDKTSNTKFQAIYFIMGHYNEDDEVDQSIIGFDCPFDDSPVLYAVTEEELERNVKAMYNGDIEVKGDWRGRYPDAICDMKGNLQPELYEKIVDEPLNPDEVECSFGRETLTQFWERESWRWTSSE